MSLLARELVPRKPILAELLSAAIVGGFWGQYIVDINAWSQAAAMPCFLFVLLTDWNHRSRWQFAAAFVAWIIIAGQIAFAIYRPLAASLLYGIHYPMPPIHRSKMWNSKETLILLT